MKYKLTFVWLLIAAPFFLKAQEEVKNFQLGFTASPNFGWAKINESSTAGYSSDGLRLGFTYGLLGDFGFSKNYFFSTAFTITSINANTTQSESLVNGQVSVDRSYKIQYIDIPLTIKLKTNVTAGKCFFGQFGLGTGIKIRGKSDVKRKSSTSVLENLKNQDIDNANALRLGLVAGAGVQWDYNENSKFITGITFNNGFTDILSKGPSIRNSFFALNLGVLF